ncbi:uncharacterized protein F5147DRAFT_839613 [Suillus discolor]|uniref:Uncharacterized protein n=1 Tax=Suillus discolor TaxID=1912936 RepID=A0A9P7JPY0_9AGAM|nr:uncharacterized protein F5147DRAFT_839613 [Suillus discolor]KAG2098395.1 hypothetical protein F5147DRAFT_839613 [Suillus discolor]
MDAQRFDPLRRTNMVSISSEKTSASDVRPDHEIVVDLVEGKYSDLRGSCPSPKDTCTTHVTTSVDKVSTHTITRSEPNPCGGAPIVSVTEIVFRRPPSGANTSSPSQSSPSVSPRSIPPPSSNDSVDTVATGTIIHSDPNPCGGAPIVSRAQMVSRGVWSHSPCRTQMVFTGVLSRSFPTNTSSPSQSFSPSASSRSTPPPANEPFDVLATYGVQRGVVALSVLHTDGVNRDGVVPSGLHKHLISGSHKHLLSPQSSSPSASSQSTPPPGFIKRALNRFNTTSASDSDVDDLKVHRRKKHTLLVIVKERREKHKDDRAFKDIAGNVFPAASVKGST